MLEDHPLSGTQIRGHRIGSHDVDLPILVRPTCLQPSGGKLVLAIGRAQRMVTTRSALSRKGKRARGRDGDQRRLPLRRCALHHRGRPDQRNCLSLPGLPKFTGSAFAALVRVPKEALTIEATLRTFSSLGGSGNPILRHFCPECGSSIAEEPGTRPGVIILNVETFDDPSIAKPGREVFRDDALPWVEVHSEIPRSAKRPG